FATVEMEHGNIMQSKGQTVGMRRLLGQGECRLYPGQGLVRIPQQPQRPGGPGEAHDPGIKPAAESQRAVALGIIESNTLLEVGESRNWFSQVEQGRSQHRVRFLEAY